MLGTGTPNPVPERSGPCVAIVVGESSYLVDIGSGVTRQAQKAVQEGITGLKVGNLKRAFITHLHSDHTLGFADLILTPWVLERSEPLIVFGPQGTKEMTRMLLNAYQVDINARINGLEQANKVGIQVDSHEILEGLIYEDELVKVEAIKVNHPPFEAYAYKFITPDKTIVISGDTAPCDNLIKQAKGCDILVHEVYSSTGIKKRDAKWHKYHSTVHTSSLDLGQIANKINPRLLILYHQLFMVDENETGDGQALITREQEMIQQIKQGFKGTIVSAKDIQVFE
ncbi:MBL fold metallo-hydrolase [Clostridium sp. 'deep sea']|nr:MBL fold metallo-hydrolase [Clostridium sp. 'deep sea']